MVDIDKAYICPMHPEIVSDAPSKCPKCGMKLVLKSSISSSSEVSANNYTPLIVVVSLILLTSFLISFSNGFEIKDLIKNFMIGFFMVFGGFKLMDLKGFSEGYSTYDLLAQRFFTYGYIYPFIEIFFAVFMILNIFPVYILYFEVVVMAFSGLGVLVKLLKKEKFQCVCLGTFLKVPLTKVTLIEDFGMAFLAALLILLG